MKAGQMKRRADEDEYLFFFFNQTFSLALQRGRRSQQPIKTRHQKMKTPALFITLFYVLCFLFSSEELNLLNMRRHRCRN